MAWEWSHMHEAYRDAELNVGDLDDSTLAIIYAEWKSKDSREDYAGGFNTVKYIRGMTRAVYLIRRGWRASLEWVVWNQSSEQATCDNGGFNAWVCPFGCHTVPFDREHLNE